MASADTPAFCFFLLFSTLFSTGFAGRKLSDESSTQLLSYHKGPLLSGKIAVNLIWYGNFKPAQRSIIADFITSLSPTANSEAQPSVATWWSTIGKYYRLHKQPHSSLLLSLGSQMVDPTYSLGKSLTAKQIEQLARRGPQTNAVNVVLTADDVAVERFCVSTCGTHGAIKKKGSASAYIWVGNSEKQCPGQCAWPFHQPIYGPQSPSLVGPNGDVGLDGMVINLATLLAGTATNPFGNGYFQGPKEAPLEVASACPGVYGKGAYPGYAGKLLVDSGSGASYNANGANGRKYLLPALFDPSTSRCSTLV